MFRQWSVAGVLALAAWTAGPASSRADTVVLRDGRRFVGDVAVTGQTYTIKSKFGTFSVASDQVANWQKDGAPPSPAPADPQSSSVQKPAPAPGSGQPDSAIKIAEADIDGGDFHSAIAKLAPLAKDSHDPLLLHVLGLAYLKQQAIKPAIITLERALAAAGPAADRALVVNTALAEGRGKYYSRAIKTLSDYLAHHEADVDEQVLNALGITLSQSDMPTRNSKVFTNAAELYKSCNAKLEKTKPGQKRFGIDWMSAGDAEEKLRDLAAKSDDLQQARSDAADADQRVGAAQQQWQIANGLSASAYERHLAQRDLDNALRQQRDAYDRLQRVQDSARSPFPDSMDPLAIDDAKSTGGLFNSSGSGHDDPPLAFKPSDPTPSVEPTPKPPVDTPKPVETPKPVDEANPDKPVVAGPKPAVAKDKEYAAAFPVSDQLMITAASIMENVKDMSIQGGDGVPIPVTLVRIDKASGLALIRAADMKLNYLNLADKFAGGAITCPGFPTVDLFNPTAANLNGTSDAPANPWLVKLDKCPRLPGSPLIAGGAIVGVEMSGEDTDADKVPAISVDTLRKFIGDDMPGTPSDNTDPAAATQMLIVNHK